MESTGFIEFEENIEFELVFGEESKKTFTEAIEDCESKDATLAFVDNLAEFQFVTEIAEANLSNFGFLIYLLGYIAPIGEITGEGSDFLALAGAASESFFASGGEFPWRDTEPNLVRGEARCIAGIAGIIQGVEQFGLWADVDCNVAEPYFCRRENRNGNITSFPTVTLEATFAPTQAELLVEESSTFIDYLPFVSIPIVILAIVAIGFGFYYKRKNNRSDKNKTVDAEKQDKEKVTEEKDESDILDQQEKQLLEEASDALKAISKSNKNLEEVDFNSIVASTVISKNQEIKDDISF